jgi:S1-C subfamily serine protease
LRENHQGCVHCHQIQEYRLLQSFHDKTFRRSQLFGFPLPENIGLSFDGAHGHKIASVAPGSAAAKASLAPGDVVVGLDDVAIHSEQDVRWALHRAESGRPLAITVLRPARSDDDPPHSIRVELVPETGWKQTDLSWRKSLRSVPLPLGFLGYALGQEERRAADVPENRLAIRVVSLRGPGLAERLGLRKGDLIVSLDRNSARRTFEQFKSDLLRRHEPGDVVELSVLREEKSVELRGPFPDWHTTDTSVP